MSHVVISAFEDLAMGDLQVEGEAVALFATAAEAEAHFSHRGVALAIGVRDARASRPEASFITWILLLELPLPATSVEEALEQLELVIEETDEPEDPFGPLVLRYEGREYTPDGEKELRATEALQSLEDWLS